MPHEECLFADLLWADPAEEDEEDQDYIFNQTRGFSTMFGKKPTNDFLKKAGLKAIVRAHECKYDGFEALSWNGEDKPAPVVTVFSAPNYSRSNNYGAILITDGNGLNVHHYVETEERPFLLPNYPFQDAFTFFHDDIFSYTSDFLCYICSTAMTCIEPNMGKIISSISSSQEGQYISKLIKESEKRQPKEKES